MSEGVRATAQVNLIDIYGNRVAPGQVATLDPNFISAGFAQPLPEDETLEAKRSAAEAAAQKAAEEEARQRAAAAQAEAKATQEREKAQQALLGDPEQREGNTTQEASEGLTSAPEVTDETPPPKRTVKKAAPAAKKG